MVSNIEEILKFKEFCREQPIWVIYIHKIS